MTISVIIPAYKAADTIERALSSVAEQTLKPKQIIVIDDGSNDDTLKIVESFKEHIYEIEIIIFKQQNLGAGAARNRAINAATGEWLAFLDADDEWHPKKLSTSMDAIRKHNLVLVSHNYYRIDKTSKKPIFCSTRFEAATNPYRGLYRKGFIATSSVVVLRDAVLSVGGFDETLKTAQDFDLWLKILKKENIRFRVEPDFLMNYFVTPGSITNQTSRRLDCTLRIAINYAPSCIDLHFRIFNIHYEAINASLSKGHIFNAMYYFIKLPFHLTWLTHKYSRRKDSVETNN